MSIRIHGSEQALKNILFLGRPPGSRREIAGHVPDEAVDYIMPNMPHAGCTRFSGITLFGFDMDYSQYKPEGITPKRGT